jgi:hypothetical protein
VRRCPGRNSASCRNSPSTTGPRPPSTDSPSAGRALRSAFCSSGGSDLLHPFYAKSHASFRRGYTVEIGSSEFGKEIAPGDLRERSTQYKEYV